MTTRATIREWAPVALLLGSLFALGAFFVYALADAGQLALLGNGILALVGAVLGLVVYTWPIWLIAGIAWLASLWRRS